MQLPHLAVCVCELNTVCTNNHVYVHIRCMYVQYGEMEFSVKEPENVGKNEIETAIENKFVLEGKFSLDNRCKKSYSAQIYPHIYIRSDNVFNKYGLFSLEDAFVLLLLFLTGFAISSVQREKQRTTTQDSCVCERF